VMVFFGALMIVESEAPSTALRAVPLPRFAGAEGFQPAATPLSLRGLLLRAGGVDRGPDAGGGGRHVDVIDAERL
jgi:hypothetical protein